MEKEEVQGGIEVAKDTIGAKKEKGEGKLIWHGRELLFRPKGVGGAGVELEV